MKEIQAYKCDYCSKLYQRKWAVLSHEISCRLNPINWPKCGNCVHLVKEGREVINNNEYYSCDQYGSIASHITVTVFHCNKLNKDIYPALILRKKLHLRHPEHFATQELMPSECEFYEVANFGIDDCY